MTNAKEIVREALCSLLSTVNFRPEIIPRFVHPDYEQTVDGVTLDYSHFVSHLLKQKEVLAQLDVEFLTLMSLGDVVFSNHLVTAKKKDGSQIRVKVLAQFDLKEGRLFRCDELTHLVNGNAHDRDIGSRH